MDKQTEYKLQLLDAEILSLKKERNNILKQYYSQEDGNKTQETKLEDGVHQ